MLSWLIGLIAWLLRVANFALLLYCLMSFIMPQSDIMNKLRGYVEPVLEPFRQLLYRFFPKLRTTPLDFSPLVVWVVIEIAIKLLSLLARIFR